MTQHTNTRNRMPVHVLMKRYAHRTHANAHKRPCTCDCTSITSAHRNTQADRERTHLPRAAHPHAPSSAQPRTHGEHPRIYSPPGATHADAHRQPPVQAQSTLHALTLTHTHTHTLSARARVPGAVYSAAWSEKTAGSQPDPADRLGSRDRHAPHPTKEPLFTPSPSAPHTLRQKEHR